MGDYAQTLCDVDATDAEADELKHRLLTWLVDKRVIRPELTDCGMSSAGGHAPGENYGYAIYGREDATLDPPRLWGRSTPVGGSIGGGTWREAGGTEIVTVTK